MRTARVTVGDSIYHVINRSNGRVRMFDSDNDYKHFESLLQKGAKLLDMRILAYCIMPNHWHLVLYPKKDADMGEFMRWLTTTHVRQRQVQTKSVGHGHLYQGTYKSFPVQTDRYAQELIRYVEQNPLRAKLVRRAENWRWSSLWRRKHGSEKEKKTLGELPFELPRNYLTRVNTLPDKDTLEKVRTSVNKGVPFGSENWVQKIVTKFGLESTLRGPGRPRKV